MWTSTGNLAGSAGPPAPAAAARVALYPSSSQPQGLWTELEALARHLPPPWPHPHWLRSAAEKPFYSLEGAFAPGTHGRCSDGAFEPVPRMWPVGDGTSQGLSDLLAQVATWTQEITEEPGGQGGAGPEPSRGPVPAQAAWGCLSPLSLCSSSCQGHQSCTCR